MKKVQVVLLLLVFIGLAVCQESDDCFCADPWISWRHGRRATGDRLLFREIRSTDWHSPTEHQFNFQYQNTNITQWEVGMSPGFNGMSHATNWNPFFSLQVNLRDSTNFEVVLTAYGFSAGVATDTLSLEELRERNIDMTSYNN